MDSGADTMDYAPDVARVWPGQGHASATLYRANTHWCIPSAVVHSIQELGTHRSTGVQPPRSIPHSSVCGLLHSCERGFLGHQDSFVISSKIIYDDTHCTGPGVSRSTKGAQNILALRVTSLC
jgi:hypothetical protein